MRSRQPVHSQTKESPRGRFYIFVVVALAVFLGGIVLWQRPPAEVTARVKLRHVDGDVEIPRHTIASTITSEQAVREVLSAAGRSSTVGDVSFTRGKLLVDAHPAARPGETEVELWCVDADANQASLMARQLADRFVESLAAAAKAAEQCDHCADEVKQVRAARDKLEKAKEKLAAFMQEHAVAFASPAEEVAKVEENPPAETSASPPQVHQQKPEVQTPPVKPRPPQVAERLNPEWVELDDRLQVLRAARDELLTKRTAAHPEVRNLQWQIDELEKEQSMLRRTITSVELGEADARANQDKAGATEIVEPIEPHDVAVVDEAANEEAAPVEVKEPVAGPSPELLVQRHELTAAVEEAQQELKIAEEALRRVRSQHRPPVLASAEVMEPARIVASRGGGLSRSHVFFVGILAVLVGLMATWRSRVVSLPSQLISCEQIEALGLPVVAAISTGDGPALPQPSVLNPHWVRWLMFVCELVLAAIALTMLLLALAEWQVAAGLLRDPLSTFSEAMGRLQL